MKINIFEKQVVLFLVNTCKVKKICNLISAEKVTFQHEKCTAITGLISGWVTISIKYPVLYTLGSQAGIVDINHAFHPYYNVVCGLSFSRSQPDFDGFPPGTPVSSLRKIGS